MSGQSSDQGAIGPVQQGVTRSLAGIGLGAGAVAAGVRFWPESGESPPAEVAAGGTTSSSRVPSTTSPAATATTEVRIPEYTLADFAENIQRGGPPKDGIPPIEEPVFAAAGDVDFLEDADVVFGLSHEGVVRAYPQLILVGGVLPRH